MKLSHSPSRYVIAIKLHPESSQSLIGTVVRSFSLLLLVLAPSVVQSQTPSPVEQDKLTKLYFMIGEWKGKGWQYNINGSKFELSQTTKVKKAPNGASLRVDYNKKVRAPGFGMPFVYSGPVTIYYDEKAKVYRWRIDTVVGRRTPFEAKLTGPKGFQWIMQTPEPLLRVTINVTDEEEWHELWESWTDSNVGWQKFQESVLKKVN